MTCREFAKKYHITIVGKLTRVQNNLGEIGDGVKFYVDEDGNEFWVHGGEIVYVTKEGGVL